MSAPDSTRNDDANSQGDDSGNSLGNSNATPARKSHPRSRRRRSSNAFESAPNQDPTIGSSSSDLPPTSAGIATDNDPNEESTNNPAPRYESVEEVGRGGWGVVEKAVDKQLEREVAVKRFCDADDVTQQERNRFLHEAKVTSQLQHPGIVPVHELGDRRDAFYVMKLLDGVTLSKFIQEHHQQKVSERKTPFQFGESLEPLLQRFVDICNAVAYAHQRGVIHRDLKPSNVMISDFGETVVLDWGLAQSVEQPTDHVNVQSTSELPADVSPFFERDGTVVGTPAYMSPEQARGEVSRINRSSDLYSLGVILYTIVAGRNPYQGQPVDQILNQVRRPTCPDLRTHQPLVPKPLLSIVRKAMSSSQHDRYANAEELAGDVRRFISGDSVSVHQESMVEKSVRWCRHHQGMAATITLATSTLLIASIIFGVVIHRSHRAERLARIEAQHAHHQAIVNLGEALDATDNWLGELSGSLQFYPGMTAIRSDLLGRAIHQYDRIAAQSLDGSTPPLASYEFEKFDLPESQRQTDRLALLQRVKTQLRLADLHRITNHPEQARHAYAAAESLLNNQLDPARELRVTAVSKKTPHDALDTHFELERIHSLIGRLLVQDPPTAPVPTQRLREARHWLIKRLSSVEPVFAQADAFDLDSTKAKTAETYAQLELAIQTQADPSLHPDLKDASSYQNAIQVARWLANGRGTVGDRRLSENIQTHLCVQRMLAERYSLADESWSQLIGDLREWIHSTPDHIDLLQSCAHALHQRGNCRAHQGMQTEAIADLKSSLGLLEKVWQLTEMDPAQSLQLDQTQQDFDRLQEATRTNSPIGTINNTIAVETDFDEAE